MRWTALVAVLTIPGCFDPARNFDDDDDEIEEPEPEITDEPTTGDGPMCTELEDDCEVNGDCLCFDGSARVGTGLCVGNGELGQCTTVCAEHSDCGSGCCAALEGDDAVGACAPSSHCSDSGTTGEEPSGLCLDGVAMFCACAVAAGVDCAEEELEAFAATCSDPSHVLHTVFECWGGLAGGGLDACGDGLDACEVEHADAGSPWSSTLATWPSASDPYAHVRQAWIEAAGRR
ncbi:MAG: hypothetical protein K0V04_10230 [Deltaproteobacteria bacterium]|nr:hypothetical protein [Deltaproteobacteria bacterium]